MKNKINLGIIGKNFGFQVVYKAFLKNKNFNVMAFPISQKILIKLKYQKILRFILIGKS